MSNQEIIKTNDGSFTLKSEEFHSTYHSIHGARTESEYVFIQEGLVRRLNIARSSELHIFEMGFGTGLNAWLTALYALENQIKINYTTIDLFPLKEDIYNSIAVDEVHGKILHSTWEDAAIIHEYFSITKKKLDLSEFLKTNNQKFDVIYYDAFGPGSQPALWEDAIFEQLYNHMNSHGVFVTYCAKGSVRRALKNGGFDYFKIDGPPGKRHMIVAVKPAV
ncbi:MAG: tRNA (5-methylaminomethyl-2-thiouridine)(34)-methyltransferase MnmD [Bacteroidetes bacterium]|nr:tRNA (5-methylaminomethyl-2-thiouridine)(34)-methyltransferase MnmD [Bacteroidota bacterium]